MAGHSKWAQIKHKKAATDAKKSKIFSKLAAAITVAAREGGGDPDKNPKLRLAIEKARSFNMPSDNIERAIKRGTGALEGAQLEELLLEAYGPNGHALLISAITDNRNRTLAEIKHILNKYDGKLGTEGSVRWMFDLKGKIILETPKLTEEEELKLIDWGVEDIQQEDDNIIVYTQPDNLYNLQQQIKNNGFRILEASLDFIPKNIETISDEEKNIYEKLFDELDEQAEVKDIYSTIEF
ncbi:MAG: YebC/PmpR family DNA-binding transcriptional regulator [Patescibacteria group bacterium]|jgi:YebC/PmpR family DNA-binding regulatory protein|nr:YebC/PmpR family DNA-binding transcriptional regulator [Patescibacteria group bacterium]